MSKNYDRYKEIEDYLERGHPIANGDLEWLMEMVWEYLDLCDETPPKGYN